MSGSANGGLPPHRRRVRLRGNGSLRKELDEGLLELAPTAGRAVSINDLTVLGVENDPYRKDTKSGHRDGRWFADQLARFVPNGKVHLRGLHYLISSAADVVFFDRDHKTGSLYTNTDENWSWLQIHPAKSARFLGYVPFDRIIDARNDEADYEHIPEASDADPWRGVAIGDDVSLPALADVLPELAFGWGRDRVRQPYRIVLMGEKTSLADVLKPIAVEIGAEVQIMSGENSDTRIYQMCERAAEDGRKLIVLYVADFDPSGHQMPISVARKVQAFRTLFFPDLDAELHRVALTLSQCETYKLPSTPMKIKDTRTDKWKEKFNREQTEIDAMLALHPDALARIVRDAIAPFYDPTLATREQEITDAWHAKAQAWLEDRPEYQRALGRIETVYAFARTVLAQLRRQRGQAVAELRELVESASDAPALPDPPEWHEPEDDPPEPLFTTEDNFVAATLKLKADKALGSTEADDPGNGGLPPPKRERPRLIQS